MDVKDDNIVLFHLIFQGMRINILGNTKLSLDRAGTEVENSKGILKKILPGK